MQVRVQNDVINLLKIELEFLKNFCYRVYLFNSRIVKPDLPSYGEMEIGHKATYNSFLIYPKILECLEIFGGYSLGCGSSMFTIGTKKLKAIK